MAYGHGSSGGVAGAFKRGTTAGGAFSRAHRNPFWPVISMRMSVRADGLPQCPAVVPSAQGATEGTVTMAYGSGMTGMEEKTLLGNTTAGGAFGGAYGHHHGPTAAVGAYGGANGPH